MSLLENLKPYAGSRSQPHRVGRGSGSGWGETSGRGSKGQRARKGVSLKPGFEGGQTPLFRRLPKFGFSNFLFKTTYSVINLDQLATLGESEVTLELLRDRGLAPKRGPVKLLGGGSVDKAVNVSVHACSKSAKTAIEAQGGKVHIMAQEKEPSSSSKQESQ